MTDCRRFVHFYIQLLGVTREFWILVIVQWLNKRDLVKFITIREYIQLIKQRVALTGTKIRSLV